LSYSIRLSRSAAKALLALSSSDQRRIERAVDALAHQPRPRGAKKLEGGAGELRLRVGAYRILYEVADDVLQVLVLAIGLRKDVYRRR
jgi:mRNA interferase RelE/StbE